MKRLTSPRKSIIDIIIAEEQSLAWNCVSVMPNFVHALVHSVL